MYREEHGGSDFNVEMLSSRHHMSRTSFFNKLKVLTGYAPADYIRMIRLQHAAQLLKQGEYTIAEITDMVGFSDAKYFREVFKKYYGVSPSKYGSRKRQDLLRQLIFQVRLISKKPCKNDCFSQGLFVWKEYFL